SLSKRRLLTEQTCFFGSLSETSNLLSELQFWDTQVGSSKTWMINHDRQQVYYYSGEVIIEYTPTSDSGYDPLHDLDPEIEITLCRLRKARNIVVNNNNSSNYVSSSNDSSLVTNNSDSFIVALIGL
ncbi:hypothetical protein CR513_27943, partial [Mucuna pruriens]